MSSTSTASTSVRRTPHKGWLDVWRSAPFVVAAIVVFPVLALPYLALFPSENIWPHLWSTVLPGYVVTTLELMVGAGIGTILVGVSTAWLVTMFRFPGSRVFEWALLLPLAMPAYVVAYVYTDLLEFAGPVQSMLRDLFGWQSARDYWFPEIRSLGGAASVMTLVLFPYVYLLARASFAEQSASLLEASRTLGSSAWGAFFRVALPGARPAIAVGVALVSMETLNDFGTVDYFGVYTLSTGVFDVWLNMNNVGGAAQIAVVMLVFVVALITLERTSRRRQKHYHSTGLATRTEPRQLARATGLGAFALCGLVVALGFALPVAVLLGYAVTYFGQSWTAEYVEFALASFGLALVAAVSTVVIGMLFAYSVRLRDGRFSQALARTASLGYAVPGAVLALGVIVPFGALDNWLDDWMRTSFGVSTGLLLSGTTFAIGFAYAVRFLAVPTGGIEASLAKVTPSMDMAARTMGYGAGATFVRVHLPLIRGGMFAAGAIVFVDCMKELPATLILRPFNFNTLATYVYQYASDEQIELAALGALTIVLVGLAPVVVLSRAMRAAGGGRAP